MGLIFNSIGLLCCGCGMRYSKRDARYIYKKACLCNNCFKRLEKTGGNQCIYGKFYNDFTYAPFYYKALYREIFLSFKFRGNRSFGHLLGMAAADCVKNVADLYEYELVVPVPLSKERYNERGYNQSDILALYTAAALGKEMKPYLKRIKHSPAQSSVSGIDRMNNVKNAFRADENVVGKKIILYDDVHTTGATLFEAANTLLEAGAKSVCLACAAYVHHEFKEALY